MQCYKRLPHSMVVLKCSFAYYSYPLNREGKVFGLDLEWRPTFIKGGKENKTALVQLCNSTSILIIQISRMGGMNEYFYKLVLGGKHRLWKDDYWTDAYPVLVFPHELKGLLQNRNILKTGVNIKGKIPLSVIAFPATGFLNEHTYPCRWRS